MTPEERKAIARVGPPRLTGAGLSSEWHQTCEAFYPECCVYHEGFDAALGLLVLKFEHEPFKGQFVRYYAIEVL